ncbi:MAG: hypothetical protein AMXMBFR83_31790 [Phycisphaerae bacterium]
MGPILGTIVAVGAALRVANLGQSPPGLNQDEAVNAWNAWCLLKTGKDQHGVSWPILYTRALGENRSTLYLYYLIPFQAVGGLNIWTLRFASAFGGVLTLPLVYYLGRRMFGQAAGLAATALLALNPWHIQQSRWGNEGAIAPLLVSLSVAFWLWARLPLDDQGRPPRAIRAGLAGAISGMCCYGYAAIRLFLPLFLILVVAVTWRAWRRQLASRRGLPAVALFATAGAAAFAPLAWTHWRYPDMIGRRLEATRTWNADDPAAIKIIKVLRRYPAHYDPRRLFFTGDPLRFQSPPGIGFFHVYMLPFMLAGVVVLLRDARASPSARILLAWVALYPAGDLVTNHPGIHAVRCLPGLCGLVLLGAVGAVRAARALYAAQPRTAVRAAVLTALVIVVSNTLYLRRFFVDFNRDKEMYTSFHADFVEACAWLRPRWADYDAVFCTSERVNMPYALSLVVLGYDPRRWFEDPRTVARVGDWETYTRYGKMYFLYPDRDWTELEHMRIDSKPQKAAFIIRPFEIIGLRPDVVVRGPGGVSALWICEQEI